MPQTNSTLVQTSPIDEPDPCPVAYDVLQPEVISPKSKNVCRAFFEKSNGKCAMLSGAIYGFLTVIVWCQIEPPSVSDSDLTLTKDSWLIKESNESDNQCQTYLLVPIIFATLFYISYLLENWQYYTKQEDLITISIPSTINWIDKMKRSLPLVWWKASCYHYTVFPCRHGAANRATANVTYQRVVSHCGTARYNYLSDGFRDVSSVIQGLDKSALTRIHFSKSFVFFTATAAKEFEEQRKSFFRDYQTRDDYMEMREGMDLMDIDFPDHVIVVRDLDGVPWWRRKWTFILAVLFLQAAPLRIFLALRTATLHYNVLKVFGMDERESNWVLPGETFGEELLPPSYSEIMLGESLAPTTAAIRPRDFGRFLLQKTGILVKSATSGFAESSSGRENEKAGHSELSGGVRARGLTTPGFDPISPAVELRTAREFTEILRRNGPKMFEGRMKRSNTAPVLSVVERSMRETVVRCTKPSCSWVNSLGSPV